MEEDHTKSPDRDHDGDDPSKPTEWEIKNLRHVADKIPWTIFCVALTELAERFTYRSISAPMQNYIQHSYDNPLRPGALGMGQGSATAISFFYKCWTFLTPTLGAIVADSWLGRYRTICLGTGFAGCGVLVLFATSFPASIEQGAGLPGLLVAIFLIGIGAGGIKSNVAPLIAEQYNRRPMQIRTLASGEKVIIDPNITVQTIFGRYYWFVNVGSLSIIPASWLELKVSFWAAYLLPLGLWVLAGVVLVLGRKVYVVQKPCGSILTKAARALWVGLSNGGNLDGAKPSAIEERHPEMKVIWDDMFIEELKRGLIACGISCIFPIYCLCSSQIYNNLVSQASSMETYGIPNDMMGCFNAIGVLLLIPVMEKVVFPSLQRLHIDFKPVTRIVSGFVVLALAYGYSAGIQALIYQSPPCYNHPLQGSCSDGGKIPNNVNVFLQVPIYILVAIAAIWAYVAGMEYAYTKAPKSMRSIVSSLFLFAETVGALLGIALSPVSKDPLMVILYASVGGAALVTAIFTQAVFGKYNKVEEEMNRLNNEEETVESTEEKTKA